MKYQLFGEWLKAKLKANGILQKDFAKEICVSTNTVTSWTTGIREPGIRNFIWICRYFAIIEGVHPTEIISEAADLF
tara:strand:- start:786 stop:1016 length:231 start_codon:yes stop_codon:yes gene_type:complete